MIDTHAHIFSEEYDEDLDDVIKDCLKEGVNRVILPAIDSVSNARLECTYNKYNDFCYPTIGLHPTSVNDNPDFRKELEIVKNSLENRRLPYVAVGEIGLDLYWSNDFIREQIESFRFQIELTKQYNLPLIIHCRDAFDEIFEVLKDYQNLSGVFHGFSGTTEDYLKAKTLGNFVFGIGGVITFKNSKLNETVEVMEMKDIVLETDSPYLTPVPYRGKRNNPKFISIIASRIAETKGLSFENVAEETTLNARRIFNI